MEKLKVVLDWFPNTNHIGFLIAQKRGWFAEAGLDVEIFGDVHGEMELHGADFVCGPEIAMLDCMERGIGLTAVAVMTQKCDSGIVSLKEAGITRPRELEGKRLTHWSPEWFHKAISRVMAKDGGDYGKVKLVNLDVGDIVATLGTVADATWVYENWENQVLLEAGKEINYFNLGDFDPIFNFCAPAIAATHEVLENRPEAVKAFLACLDRGYRYGAAHPEEAVLEVKDMMPGDSSDALLIRSQKHLSPILLDEKGRWGRIGIVTQSPQEQFIGGTVRQEIAASLREDADAGSEKILRGIRLWRYRDVSPYLLSQGQQRRLGVAALMAYDCRVLVCDEPTYAQDRTNTMAVMDELCRAARSRRAALIFSTHDRQLAEDYGDVVLRLEGGKLHEAAQSRG